jgi:hypothetical protein
VPFCSDGLIGVFQFSVVVEFAHWKLMRPGAFFQVPLPFRPLSGSRQVTLPDASKL